MKYTEERLNTLMSASKFDPSLLRDEIRAALAVSDVRISTKYDHALERYKWIHIETAFNDEQLTIVENVLRNHSPTKSERERQREVTDEQIAEERMAFVEKSPRFKELLERLQGIEDRMDAAGL